MALSENVGLVRDLQQAGNNIARLSRWMSLGVTPSRENLQKAQTWFQKAATELEPHLVDAEAAEAVQRARPKMKG